MLCEFRVPCLQKNVEMCKLFMAIWFIINTFALIKNYQMKKGTVKFFNDSKGYGFIKDNETGNEYFVHATGLVDEISENNEVEFELQEGRKGLNAVNVKLA